MDKSHQSHPLIIYWSSVAISKIMASMLLTMTVCGLLAFFWKESGYYLVDTDYTELFLRSLFCWTMGVIISCGLFASPIARGRMEDCLFAEKDSYSKKVSALIVVMGIVISLYVSARMGSWMWDLVI